ncbi:unnamed protein product [Amoebophrya sp. A120]|nr:unnamed protein product [Amoebophrya sp. A120]|eukprot:GSA120T00012114001.1
MDDLDALLDDVLGPSQPPAKTSPPARPKPFDPQQPDLRSAEIFVKRPEPKPAGLIEGTKSLLDDVLGEVIGLDTSYVASTSPAPPSLENAPMMCRKCDFNVLTFEDSFWLGKCDYMFFRNHFPQVEKLQTGLGRKPGKKALACQCRWAVIDKTQHPREAGVSTWILRRN